MGLRFREGRPGYWDVGFGFSGLGSLVLGFESLGFRGLARAQGSRFAVLAFWG